jgi:glycosyltransferase involved in cell wall biosynthesis
MAMTAFNNERNKTISALGFCTLSSLFILLCLLLNFIEASSITTTSITTSTTSDNDVKQILWMYPVISGGGYSSEGTAFVQELSNVESFDLAIEHHGDSVDGEHFDSLPTQTRNILVNLVNKRMRHLMPEGMLEKGPLFTPDLIICHSEPGAWLPPSYSTSLCPHEYNSSTITVGRTMFETDRLPDNWALRLNKMDELWAPSQHMKSIFLAGGVTTNVEVLGEPVDTDFFNPVLYEPLPSIADASRFTFLSIFKWEERKGWDLLLEAYFDVFTKNDKVQLVILTSEYHSASDVHMKLNHVLDEFVEEHSEKYSSRDSLPIVKLLSRLPQGELPQLYKAADVFVLPSRGEGWGRPHVEAMAMELPIIATNWGGSTEFLTEENSFPLRIDGLTKVKEGPFAEQGHYWAAPSPSHLRFLLRHVVEHKNELKEKGLIARANMLEHYTPIILAERVTELMNALFEKYKEKVSSAAHRQQERKTEL